MKIYKKLGSALVAAALSVSLGFSGTLLKINAAQKQDFLVSWFPLADFSGQMAHNATEYNSENNKASLALIADGANISIDHITANTKTHHGYTSNKGWTATEKWWEISGLSSVDHRDITISFAMKSSNTGPRDFLLQYSKDGETWFDAGAKDEPIKLTMTNVFKYYGPFTLSEELDDCSMFYLRIYKEDNVSVDGKTVGSAGTNSITEIILQGIPINDDGRTVLSEWYISQAEANSNHAYYDGKDFTVDKPHFMATGGLYADLTSFWLIKVNPATQLPKVISTSSTSWFEGGVRYQTLEKESFWIMELSSKGFEDLRISWEMRATAMAPADYRLQYSLNYNPASNEFGDWVDINPAIQLAGDIPFGHQLSRFTYNLPAAVSDQQQFHLRLLVASNRAVNGTVDGVDKVNAAFHVNNIYITAFKMKEVAEKQKLSAVEASPKSGYLEVGALVELTQETKGTTIYYQINNGETLEYQNPIGLTEKMFIGDPAKVTIKTWAENDLYLDSELRVYEYELKLAEKPVEPEEKPKPETLPPLPPIIVRLSSNWVYPGTEIELSSSLPNVTIFFRINNDTEKEYAGVPIVVEDKMFIGEPGKMSLKVRGELTGYQATEEVEYLFSRFNFNTLETGDSSNWLTWGLLPLMLLIAGGQIYHIKKSKGKESKKSSQ